MTDAPAVSILIPVYNTAKYLDRALDSVFAQTRGDLEAVVIDDASPDGIADVMARRMPHEKRLKLVRHAGNRGTAAARRSGLDAARGGYILCLDADDTLDPGALDILLETAGRTGADIIGFGARELRSDGSRDPHGNTLDATPFELDGDRIFDAVFRAHAYSWSLCLKLIRRELFLKAAAEIPDSRCVFAEDFMYFTPIARFARKLVMTGEIFYNYYQDVGITGGETVSAAAFERAASMLNALKNVRAFLERQGISGKYEGAFRAREKEQLRLLWEKRARMAEADRAGADEYLKTHYDAERIESLFAGFAQEAPAAGPCLLKRLIRTESAPWKLLKRMQGAVRFRKSRAFYDC